MTANRDALFCFVAAAALVLAALGIVFGLRPGGFETQIGWFYGLLPGELPAQVVASKLALNEGEPTRSVVFGFGLLLTLGWYFLLCFAVLRVWRRFARPADGWWPDSSR
jgi:hypothetical protein